MSKDWNISIIKFKSGGYKSGREKYFIFPKFRAPHSEKEVSYLEMQNL